ncbi:uncharacterized protein ATNIH1004_005476 [Aspergillus tanneri]|uniref:Nephrocystin 3-like N-terminal domain-containing protein n=1 Tax=Aspergillus tanneri TaxID=1220188 RepID=A0A5M9MIG8_9EURO|nr:uncharacterized protein ATNIH1004_005476 [Aspergillus tanneri]KAA8646801.1 hypothetical protein ATNIH1004_005476 [Aspergillus tanneri]
MESLASALDETVKSPSAKPSALIWGRIKHLFKPFAFTYASALAELQESRQVFLSAVQEAKCATMQIRRSIPIRAATQPGPSRPVRSRARLLSLPALEVDRKIVTEGLLNRLQESQNIRCRENKTPGQDLLPFTQWLQPTEYDEALQRSNGLISNGPKPTRSAKRLWIYGDAGTGKTPLAAAMIKDNKSRVDSINPPSENQYGLYFVFISPTYPAGQSIAGMLKYLVAQLEQYTYGSETIRKVLDMSLGGIRSSTSCTGLAAALLALYDNVYPLVKLLVLSRKEDSWNSKGVK